MKFLTSTLKPILALLLVLIIAASATQVAEAALVVNKYTNDFTLSSPNNEQLKVCSCSTKTDLLIIENVGNFEANYHVDIISPVASWMTLSQTDFTLPPKHRYEIINYVETPCSEVGTYDYTVRVTSSYGREEILSRTLRADTCQNIDLTVEPKETTSNLCQTVPYTVTVKNVGTYGETYQLGFGSFDEYMNISNREFYLKSGQSYTQVANLTLPCTFYGEYDIPFTAFSNKNRIEDEEIAHLTVINEFDHSIDVETNAQLCSRVSQTIPVTITNRIDVPNDFSIALDGPQFIDVEDNQRSLSLGPLESKTLLLEATPKEGQEGMYSLEIDVTSKFGEVEKVRTVDLDVKNCYDFEIEVRDIANNVLTQDTNCCGFSEYLLNIKNAGQTIETYNILSDAPGWFTTEELTVRLNPGQSENVRIFANMPCTDREYAIPITVVNNKHPEVNETVVFTLNSQTERTCHYVGIDYDELSINKDATVVPVLVHHNGTEGGIYDVTLDSELFTLVEDQLEIWPGETRILHFESNNLSEMEFGRYINMPTFTYSTEKNPLARVSEDIDYVEHVGVQLKDKNFFVKALEWLGQNILTPGLCGWIMILLLIILLVLIVLWLLGVRLTLALPAAALARLIVLILIFIVLLLLVIIKTPSTESLYQMPENPDDYFVVINQNEQADVNLDQYFVDPDMDILSYVATQTPDIAVRIDGNIMTLTPDRDFTGENQLVVTAQDGKGGFEDSPVLSIYVVERKDLGFFGFCSRYCVHINLLLLLLILLVVLLFIVTSRPEDKNKEQKEKGAKKVFIVVPKNGQYVARKKRARKTAVRKTTPRVAKKVAKKRTLSAEQKAALSLALDRALVSSEPHEMQQVLRTHGKRETAQNIAVLQRALKAFKNDKQWTPKNRESFYKYLVAKRVLARLENKKKAAKPVKVVKAQAPSAQSLALDRALVSSEAHEMQQVLRTHGKRETKRNIALLQKELKAFKASRYKTKNRTNFYRYLKEQDVLRKLQNK